jgi:hypothetical protein
MFKTHYNKVYNYVQGKSVIELVFDGISVVLLILFVLGFTSLNYDIWVNGNIPQF